ncbi:MAG: hypothetical protein GYA23_13190 [Methanomicrobiales archaeon]|nr:hypothetical protein [Methanomicrobiales archaeon]
MICLAIVTTVVCLAMYFLIVQPSQALIPPTNICTYHHTWFGNWWSCT